MPRREVSAGGIVYRKLGNNFQIQLIQDRYGKITFAKGKMESGESIEQTALREIAEETNIIGKIIEPLSIIFYNYEHPEHGLVNKEIHYFLVEASQGALKAQNEEINSVDWFNADNAWMQQCQNGYDNNIEVLHKALERLGIKL
ncbi:8-oxo-dGTP pyrophosphatase MutT (NUDIX family) [Paenibacillus sp. V4I3]|uniref:NUDIX hydrolase n=1 Tax=unclassified Paenibacillus TaxID=185978 RepID=UPI00277EE6A5|nr:MULTISPECIES: NUDIX domain-containing protein [unclassified Paenibacillus]MDQ0875891.1 8-oxo-dGTP pyrophosphatase MutT (NUDIX family) [Paenibacillus sp. V4I3]MDQ0888046.1 8-oxo-dGTP pyrophosphatase MutT (NUDIX family) [Paenibacillus sp. V4I9]